MMKANDQLGSGWVFRAGAAHALAGLSLLVAALHPLRDALDVHALELVKIIAAVEAINGVALASLATRLTGVLAPAMIAGGVAASVGMILIIAFTGSHGLALDAVVPLGGSAMAIGWLLLMLGIGVK